MIQFHENIPQNSRDLIQIILKNQKFKHYITKAEQTNLGVRGEMKADIKSKDDVKLWLETLEQTTNTTYRVNYTKPSVGVWILYKLGVKCHHNTGGKKLNSDQNRSCKNTKCPSRITFTVNAIPKKIFKRNCSVDPELPTVIDFYYEHNHPINSADVLRFRPVDTAVEEKLMSLFQKGHSPGSALQILKIDLENEHPHDFEIYFNDRKYCPDLSFCHRLFYKKFKNKNDNLNNSVESRDFLTQIVDEYNKQCNMLCAKITIDPADDLILTVCTPLMLRIHQNVQQSAEIMFIDTGITGCVKEKQKEKEIGGHKMFFLSTYTQASGCLPLGVIVTVSDSVDVIYKGLEMYKSILQQNDITSSNKNFYGRGGDIGPNVIMSDDNISERMALNMAWRYSTLLLCTFHIVQRMWRWLIKSQNCIKKDDRRILFQTFKTVIRANTERECEENYNQLKYLAKDHQLYLNYISSLWERRTEWALCYRTAPSTRIIRTNSTTNVAGFTENIINVVKDEIFERVKSFNLIQLADFIFTRFEASYNRKLLDSAYDRTSHLNIRAEIRNPYWKQPTDNILKGIRECEGHESGMYVVPSESEPENVEHIVDKEFLCCTCTIGRNGVMCKHQYWVTLVTNKTRDEKSLECRKLSYYLATGDQANDMWLLHNTGDGRTQSQAVTVENNQVSNDHHLNQIDNNSNSLDEIWNDGLTVLKDKFTPDNLNQLKTAAMNFINILKTDSITTTDLIEMLNNLGKTVEREDNSTKESINSNNKPLLRVRPQRASKKRILIENDASSCYDESIKIQKKKRRRKKEQKIITSEDHQINVPTFEQNLEMISTDVLSNQTVPSITDLNQTSSTVYYPVVEPVLNNTVENNLDFHISTVP